ncbi:tetratricopeptide repeat protein [Nannocystaceae bacterium ST9]
MILALLGTGGMGVVYSAYDPELDRKLAIKLLRFDRGEGRTRRHRLLREAHALAQLSHSNVIAIHDVGVHEGHVWLAMEFVDGRTLGAWLGEAPRNWREILAVVVEVGRGLAAAHAIGLLHRDIKPDNVMIGFDGRVRLMDFGLARAENHFADGEPDERPAGVVRRPPILTLELTQAGTVLGTPAYMAPEQLLGLAIDARADQFSLCVVLWEALHGERPYVLSPRNQPIPLVRRTTPRRRGVPAWLRRVCQRGLVFDADQRWPSVAALLDALERGQARVRRWAWSIAGASVASGIAALFGAGALERARAVHACEVRGDAIFEKWNDDARAELHESMNALAMPDAAATADRTIAWLDQFAEHWREAEVEVCLDHGVREVWDADSAARAHDCLAERLVEFDLLLTDLRDADVPRAHRSIQAASGLRVDSCRNASTLRSLPRAPMDLRVRIPLLRAQSVRASALEQSGDLRGALALARTTHEQAQTLGWDPLTARAGARLGRLLARDGDFEAAERTLEDSYFLADRSGAFDVRIEIAGELVELVGFLLARPEDGLRWSRLAEAALVGWGSDEPLARASILADRGLLEYRRKNYRATIELYEESLALEESILGPNHPKLYESLNRLGTAHDALGDSDRAVELYRRALALARATLGPSHPDIAAVLTNLGIVHCWKAEYEQGKQMLEQALAIRRAALGPDHPLVADSLNNLAFVLRRLDQNEAALAASSESLAIRERSFGPDHPDVVQGLLGLALLLEDAGQPERARALHAEALARAESSLGPAHLEVLRCLAGLARTSAALGRDEEAHALLERAARLVSTLAPIDDADLLTTLLGLAELTTAYELHDAGEVIAGEALALAERADLSLATPARWYLGRALLVREPQRARALIEQARAECVGLGDECVALLGEIDEWSAGVG